MEDEKKQITKESPDNAGTCDDLAAGETLEINVSDGVGTEESLGGEDK